MRIIRKPLLIVLVCLMFGCQSFFIIAEQDDNLRTISYSKGDLNGDGNINAVDYVILKKYLSGERVLDPKYHDACDVNDDGAIDDYDELRLKNIVYYGEVDNLFLSVDSKSIHTKNQRLYLESDYDTIGQYGKGGDASEPIVLEYDSDIIPDGSRYTIKVSEKYDMSDAKTYTSYSRSISIDNSKVQQLYFWTVNNGSRTSAVQAFYVDDVPVRNLSTGTIGNARDIGGFETEDGYVVKQGMIYRGHMMSPGSNLSKNRDILINDLGIQTEIDIKEKQSDSSIYYDTSVLNTRPNQDFDHYLRRYLKYEMGGGYLNYNSKGQPTYASMSNIIRIFHDLSDESNYPVYIHCRIGADRTGLMCFLFNALLGVSKEDCYKDYSFTTFSGDPRSAGWIANDYVLRIEETEGRTFAEKTYNLLVKLGVNADDLDKYIAIMKQKKPSVKSYLQKPKAVESILHYDGSEKQLILDDDYLFNVTGDKATEVGEYAATVSLKDPVNYSWSDGSKSDITIPYRIEDVRESVAMPIVESADYVYSAEEYEVFVEQQDYYTVTGNKAVDAGDYEIVVSLTDKSKYVWEDDSNDDLIFNWTIEKADVDLSELIFEDATFVYDGSEKSLVYTGELPEGIESVEYIDNTAIGHPNQLTTLEATLSFVTDDNHNPIDDMKATLVVEPIISDITLSFDELNQNMQISYGDQYQLPTIDRQDYQFKGWYMDVDGIMQHIDQSGIWEYETTSDEITLYPLFEYLQEVATGISEVDNRYIISINETGNGIACLVESDVVITDNNYSNCRIVGLYEMNTNGYYSIAKNISDRYYYLLLNNQLLYDFDGE